MMRGVNLLGEDGNGYELALKLEGCGAWKAWFDGGSGIYGDGYSKFVSFLSSPAAWESFMSSSPPTDSSSSRQILHLQLRTRALLFDKASISLFLSSSNHNDNDDNSLSHLNPQYLQLHGDDIFFSLEPEDDEDDDECDVKLDNKKTNNIITNKKKNNNSKNNADANSYQVHPRHSRKGNEKHPSYDERSSTAGSQRHSSSSNSNRNEVLPKTWYNQYIDKLRANYPKFPNCEKESLKRTSEGMSAYLHHSEIHKSKRKALLQQDDICLIENGTCDDKDFSFFPEITFPSNCVPASALPLKYESEKNHSVLEFHGILDNLPNVASKSTAMMERFGIKPDYIKVGSKYRGVDGSGCEKKPLCQEQALVMTQQVVARLLYNTGFKGGTANSMEVFSEFLCDRICKLGRVLKLLTDSYRKQYSSIELLQMFLQSIGQSNLGDLEESKKDGNKGLVLGSPSQVRAGQPQNQNSLLQAQHIQRQMQTQPNMSMINLQKMTFQQQQPQMRKQQSSNQLMPDVKIENTIESSPIEGPTLNSTLSKQQQHHLQQQRQMLQIRQQQQLLQQHMTVPQSTQQQFRHLQSAQVSQLQTQNAAYGMRTRPIKVEGYPDMLPEDSALKHDSDHNQLACPSK